MAFFPDKPNTKFLHFSFSWVGINVHTKFQLCMMPVSGPKVCGGGGGWVCKPILELSLEQAEQFIRYRKLFNKRN